MPSKNQKSTKEQRIALLQECMASGLKPREYAALKDIGYSTLTRWASQLGVSLSKTSLPPSQELPGTQAVPPNNNGKESFSFINITEQIKEAAPNFCDSFLSNQFLQAEAPACDLEIRMPNGVMVKVGQVPFDALRSYVVEFVRAFA